MEEESLIMMPMEQEEEAGARMREDEVGEGYICKPRRKQGENH